MENYTPRFKSRYRDEVVPGLQEQFGYANVMQVPRLQKIVINKGVGEASQLGHAVGDRVALLDVALRSLAASVAGVPEPAARRRALRRDRGA